MPRNTLSASPFLIYDISYIDVVLSKRRLAFYEHFKIWSTQFGMIRYYFFGYAQTNHRSKFHVDCFSIVYTFEEKNYIIILHFFPDRFARQNTSCIKRFGILRNTVSLILKESHFNVTYLI